MRLIDADELLKGKEDHQMISTHLIWNAPTVDAVPVVRCKDCKLWNGEERGGFYYFEECALTGMCTQSDDFCSFGERKEE